MRQRLSDHSRVLIIGLLTAAASVWMWHATAEALNDPLFAGVLVGICLLSLTPLMRLAAHGRSHRS